MLHINSTGELELNSKHDIMDSVQCESSHFIINQNNKISKIPLYDIDRKGIVKASEGVNLSENNRHEISKVTRKIGLKTFLFLLIGLVLPMYLLFQNTKLTTKTSIKIVVTLPLLFLLIPNLLFGYWEIKYLFAMAQLIF